MIKILLDENIPVSLKRYFSNMNISIVAELGWSGKTNGELLKSMEQ